MRQNYYKHSQAILMQICFYFTQSLALNHPTMPVICCIIGCSNRSGRDKVSFYSIPTIIKNQGEKTQALSEERRHLWLRRISRAETPTNNWRVCSKHFHSGRSQVWMGDFFYWIILIFHALLHCAKTYSDDSFLNLFCIFSFPLFENRRA